MKRCWVCGRGNECVHAHGIGRPHGIKALPAEFWSSEEQNRVVLPPFRFSPGARWIKTGEVL